jgi:chromate transporter
LYLRIGLIGIGPAFYTETNKHFVQKRQWISEADFVNGLALAQLLPGATYASITVYIGYILRGPAGAIITFFAFLLTSFVMMLVLSKIYFVFGALPQFEGLFKGVAVVVAGILPHAVFEISKSSVTDWRGLGIAIGAVVLLVVAVQLARHSLKDVPSVFIALAVFLALRFGKINVVWVVLGGTAVYWLWG